MDLSGIMHGDRDQRELILQVLAGSRTAADQLVRQHQGFIYALAFRLEKNAEDAADLTQEVLLKMLSKLSQFQFKSSFRTWLYRITMNHFLRMNSKKTDAKVFSLEEWHLFCEALATHPTMTRLEQQEQSEQTTAIRNKCMSSTLLCLDKKQRLVLMLGTVFNVGSAIASQLLGITPENFRQQLSRARTDLNHFMNNQCSLINPENPCRCYKKARGFMLEGKIDPLSKLFTRETLQNADALAGGKNKDLDQLIEDRYLPLFSGQRCQELADEQVLVEKLLADPEIKEVFLLH